MGVTFHEDTKFHDELEKRYKKPTIRRSGKFVEDLKQQRLKGRYFLVTKSYAISITVFFGLLFIGISSLIKSANRQVIRHRFRYDNLTESGKIEFELQGWLPHPIYFYYELTNTFLMHRSLRNFCDTQFFGLPWPMKMEGDECDTWKLSKYSCANPTVRSWFSLQPYCAAGQEYYAPAGGRASIMFNDSFLLVKDDKPVHWTEKGVISEKVLDQIREPPEGYHDLCHTDMYRDTAKPIGWSRHICEMGGYKNATVLKWLEPTTNKNFKKFWRVLDRKFHPNGLPPGNYTLHVDNVYWPRWSKTPEYAMEKYFWILHPSWIGTEQSFLEIMYLIVGIGLLFLSSCLVGFQIFLMNRRIVYDKNDGIEEN